MTTRKLYSEELVQLSESLEEMGNLVEASLKNLFFSIENKDMQLAERIVADDRNVNNLERSIEAQCLMLITTQQPIAQDLRTVSSILKVVTDIERIGDHASDIAELIQQMDHKQLERYSGHLQPMIAASREMVHEAVSAFVARDQKKANDVIASDDIIDKLFDKVKNDIVIHIRRSFRCDREPRCPDAGQIPRTHRRSCGQYLRMGNFPGNRNHSEYKSILKLHPAVNSYFHNSFAIFPHNPHTFPTHSSQILFILFLR